MIYQQVLEHIHKCMYGLCYTFISSQLGSQSANPSAPIFLYSISYTCVYLHIYIQIYVHTYVPISCWVVHWQQIHPFKMKHFRHRRPLFLIHAWKWTEIRPIKVQCHKLRASLPGWTGLAGVSGGAGTSKQLRTSATRWPDGRAAKAAFPAAVVPAAAGNNGVGDGVGTVLGDGDGDAERCPEICDQ